MKIVFITEDYPDKHKSVYVFVKQLVDEIARLGNECFVIAPHSITRTKRFSKRKEMVSIGEGRAEIYRPNYISTSNIKIGKFSPQQFLHKRAVVRVLKRLSTTADAIYAHFWTSAYEVVEYAVTKNIPLFVASGESVITNLPQEHMRKLLYDYVSGVICVSSKNKEESIGLKLTKDEKCKVIPNAVNLSLFHKQDVVRCRKELNIPETDFVVAFVGSFNVRKGAKRVAQALNSIQGKKVKAIFVGDGTEVPEYSDIIFIGKLFHEEIPKYLNAADVFVLPTRNEGCCNAIVEALACGLPVISSDRSFNYDILDETNSILCDPDDIESLASAIIKLRDDADLRKKLSEGALMRAQQLSIVNRAITIESFIQENIQKHD